MVHSGILICQLQMELQTQLSRSNSSFVVLSSRMLIVAIQCRRHYFVTAQRIYISNLCWARLPKYQCFACRYVRLVGMLNYTPHGQYVPVRIIYNIGSHIDVMTCAHYQNILEYSLFIYQLYLFLIALCFYEYCISIRNLTHW